MEPLDDDLLADMDAWLRGLDASALPSAPVGVSRSPSGALERDSRRLRPGRPRGKRTPRLSQLRLRPMNSTQRRKEELSFLRFKAEELGGELRALERRRGPEQRPRIRAERGGEEGSSTWRSIANRQKAEREKAERENERLLKKLQEHVRLRRAVEKLLSVCAEDSEGDEAARTAISDRHSRAELSKLRRLLQSVESHSPLLHVVMQSNSSIADGGYIKLYDTVSGEMSMEVRYNKLLPFPFTATCSVGWRAIREGRLNFFPDVTVVDSTSDTAMLKMRAAVPPIVVTPATVYQAIKWLRDEDGEHAVWEMTASTGPSTGTFPPLALTVRVWLSIHQTTMPDGSLGSEMREFAMLTAINSSGRKSTHLAGDPKSKLSESIAAAYHEMHLYAHQTLENLLLDATATV